jgi:thiosulfate reductase/polysulfide reductase chain A
MCSSECGLLVDRGDDGTLALAGNPAHPMNAGGLCPKALHADLLRLSPDRLGAPLRRVGERGRGELVPASWSDALDDIARKLAALRRTHGPECLTILFGEKPDHDVVYDFARGYGTPNVLDHNSLCDTSRRLGFAFTLGDDQERPLPDLQRPLLTADGVRAEHDCRLLVLFGENPAEARRFYWLWDGIRAAKRGGMRLVVVDPFATATARVADEWLPIRPGEDAALLLAILRHVVEHDGRSGAYLDHEFIRAWTHGWDELRRAVLTDERDPATGLPLYSLEWAGAKTGIPPDAIRRLAHELGATKPAAAMVGMNGVAHQYSGFQATRALAVLLAITGNLDVPGGLHLRAPLGLRRPRDAWARGLGDRAEKHKDRFGGFPLAAHGVVSRVPRDIVEGVTLSAGRFAGSAYATRALITIHHNPLLTAPESGAWRTALTARGPAGDYLLELLVVNDLWAHDTALYADWVLPMAHFLERQGVVEHETLQPAVSLRAAVAPAPAGVRTPLELFRELARRMGDDAAHAELLATDSDDAWCDRILEPLAAGVASPGTRPTQWLRDRGGVHARPARFAKYRGGGFRTPTGKVELTSTRLATAGVACPATPGYEPPFGPEVWRDEASGSSPVPTFRLVTGRSRHHVHSMTQNVPAAGEREPVLLMNDEDARSGGLASGRWAVVTNARGDSIRARVSATPRLLRGVVRATHGWGATSPFLTAKANGTYNVNLLTCADRVHPVTGNACFGDVLVTVTREEPGAAT